MRRKDRAATDAGELREIIEKCKVCRVAMVDNGTPYVVPLSFGYTLENGVLTLYFHSARVGKKLDILRKNSAVCFEMDYEGEVIFPENSCNSGYYFESIIGFGDVKFVEDTDEQCAALTLLMQHQIGKDIAHTAEQAATVVVYKLVTTDFCGKKKARAQ